MEPKVEALLKCRSERNVIALKDKRIYVITLVCPNQEQVHILLHSISDGDKTCVCGVRAPPQHRCAASTAFRHPFRQHPFHWHPRLHCSCLCTWNTRPPLTTQAQLFFKLLHPICCVPDADSEALQSTDHLLLPSD